MIANANLLTILVPSLRTYKLRRHSSGNLLRAVLDARCNLARAHGAVAFSKSAGMEYKVTLLLLCFIGILDFTAVEIVKWISSPLWGKPGRVAALYVQVRSTPTPVGKTPSVSMPLRIAEVHPHACGENSAAARSSSAGVGPPPRLWGKHFIGRFDLIEGRSTPTPVGKTSPS